MITNRLLAPFPILGSLLFGLAGFSGALAAPTNAILFVTQMPLPAEQNSTSVSNVIVSVASPVGNHLADTAHAGRGGDLYIRYTNAVVRNLTRAAGYGLDGAQHTNGIAVRNPHLHWSGQKAIFSMVAGAPRFAGDTTLFFWQLYEISNFLNAAAIPVITKVPNQPTNYNNVYPCYGTDERIIFASDRPRDGSPHLYPLLDEYNDIPSVTGLWNLEPATGDLFLINHTPSGAFNPFIDSYGQLIFTRWDHLVQDRNATDDRIGNTANGTGNFTDESPEAPFNRTNRSETFPEPRTFDATNLAALHSLGNAFNSFFPWVAFEDGGGEEVLNHLGRHELVQQILPTFTNDLNLLTNRIANRWNSNYLNTFFQIQENPTNAGTYFAIDGPDFGTHGAGQIVALYAPRGLNADSNYLSYITPKATVFPNPSGVFRNPLPMSDGTLVAVHTLTPNSASDSNQGSSTNPIPLYNFRLRTLQKSGATWITNQFLTGGITNNGLAYWNGSNQVAFNGPLWELDPVEVRPRHKPQRLPRTVAPIEAQVFAEEGVDIAIFQKYLQETDQALVIGRNVTTRDHADKQQPYNLHVAWPGGVQTGGTNGTNYPIGYLQFYQADQLRGLTMTGTNPIPGRRVLAVPMHDPRLDNVPVTNGPAGASKLSTDGSHAELVPANRAMTWQLTGTNGAPIVRERYWITFAPGEIRTCTSCHGINTTDQAGHPAPTNKPAALRSLLQWWKQHNTPILSLQTNASTNYLGVTFERFLPQTNVTHTVEVTTDLTSWLPGSSYNATNIVPLTPATTEVTRSGNPRETITIRDNTPMSSAPMRVMRVRASRP